MASRTTIENPVINSPFEEPQRHFRFTDTGISNEIVKGRRQSTYFIPIPKPKKSSGQIQIDLDSQSRQEENRLINAIRQRVALWRQRGFFPATRITRRLLEHWTRPDRERRLFFCQIEALETLIYLTEIAGQHDGEPGKDLLRRLQQANAQATPEGRPALLRFAAKMATGSGNLFMVFGEPDIQPVDPKTGKLKPRSDGKIQIELRGLDIYDPTTGQIRFNSTDDSACWFIETNYRGIGDRPRFFRKNKGAKLDLFDSPNKRMQPTRYARG